MGDCNERRLPEDDGDADAGPGAARAAPSLAAAGGTAAAACDAALPVNKRLFVCHSSNNVFVGTYK